MGCQDGDQQPLPRIVQPTLQQGWPRPQPPEPPYISTPTQDHYRPNSTVVTRRAQSHWKNAMHTGACVELVMSPTLTLVLGFTFKSHCGAHKVAWVVSREH